MVLIRLARQWWTQSDATALIKAQDRLFQTFVKAPFKRITAAESVGGLNSVEFRSTRHLTSTTDGQTVILAHGFGSGLGFFYHNVDALLQHPSIEKVILVDWLGMGGSDRPGCQRRPIRRFNSTRPSDSRFTTSQAVDFFVDPFSEWMNATIDNNSAQQGKVLLVGHSLGGYLAARYMLKDPSPAVSKLILASPVGFPPRPPDALQGAQLPTPFRIVDALWSSNLTPQKLIRLMGSTRGRYNTKRALMGRIPQLAKEHQAESSSLVDILGDYLYHITVAPPSGEFAMNSILQPVISPETRGVFAREPLQELFGGTTFLKSSSSTSTSTSSSSSLRSIKVLYGDRDWMRPNEASARQTMKQVQDAHAGMIQTSVEIIPDAGHHLYLDNPNEFVRHIVQE